MWETNPTCLKFTKPRLCAGQEEMDAAKLIFNFVICNVYLYTVEFGPFVLHDCDLQFALLHLKLMKTISSIYVPVISIVKA